MHPHPKAPANQIRWCLTTFTQSIVEVAKARSLTFQILELALASSTSLKSYKVAADHLAVAEAHAGPHCDIMGIYGAVRVESGLPFGQKACRKEHEPSGYVLLAFLLSCALVESAT